jgi:hypothetical protein
MEDFVAGFEETVDQYASAADWVMQRPDTASMIDDNHRTLQFIAIMETRAALEHNRQRDFKPVR